MKKGIIYKYTNLINNKIYIGQTKERLEDRHRKHLSQLSDNTIFHRAMKKYGVNNFSLEIVEDNIPLEKLDDRESYWIKYYDSYYKHEKGYNMTKGGKWGNSSQIVFGSIEDKIKELIKQNILSFQQIADKFQVSLTCISDINNGRTFYDPDIDYPIRKTTRKTELNALLVNQIIDMLNNNTNLSVEDIALTLNISSYTVGEINRGKNSWCPKNLSYPIRKGIKDNTYQNKLTQQEVIEICYKLIFTGETLENIGKDYNVAKNTIGDISRGISWKEITNQFILPIRKNKLENQTLYNSIYGIV